MAVLNKRMRSIHRARDFQWIFQCPLCETKMDVDEGGCLICEKRHTFDFAKQGYVNLLTRPTATKYDKDLFVSRRKIIAEEKFFQPLIEKLAKLISNQFPERDNSLFILDSGCGEGSHLAEIIHLLGKNGYSNLQGIGIDIAKAGIIEAAKSYEELFWSVADLAQSPFQNETFDVILNILSPSNYKEFTRLLNGKGLLLKAVPGPKYLKELREGLFNEPDKQKYSNKDVIKLFEEHFQLIAREKVHYTVELKRDALSNLLKMTPLTWGIEEERIQSLLDKKQMEITVELELLVGKKNEASSS